MFSLKKYKCVNKKKNFNNTVYVLNAMQVITRIKVPKYENSFTVSRLNHVTATCHVTKYEKHFYIILISVNDTISRPSQCGFSK